jgi:hypothetical protein
VPKSSSTARHCFGRYAQGFERDIRRPPGTAPTSGTRINCELGLQAPVQLTHEVEKIYFERSKPRTQLDDVQATDAALDLADGRLTASEQLRHVSLPKVQRLSPATQHGEKNLVGLGVQRFQHGDLWWSPYPMAARSQKGNVPRDTVAVILNAFRSQLHHPRRSTFVADLLAVGGRVQHVLDNQLPHAKSRTDELWREWT